jgi:hypothetical protein
MTKAPRRTSGDEVVLTVLVTGSSEAGILAQESRGQAEMVQSEVLPSDLRGRGELEALGFTFGEPLPSDPMFMPAALPQGWRREGSDHAMWSYILDDLGRRRVAIFYKAAFYDRSAHAAPIHLSSYLYDCVVEDKEPVLGGDWPKDKALTELAGMAAREDEEVRQWREDYAHVDESTREKYAGMHAEKAAKYRKLAERLAA